MLNLSKDIAKEYQKRLKDSRIPLDPSKRSNDQEASAQFIYLALTLEVSADSRLDESALLDKQVSRRTRFKFKPSERYQELLNKATANPITFSVTPKIRQGTFSSNTATDNRGYNTISWEIILPTTSDYQNPANQVVTQLLVNGVDVQSVWQGSSSYTSNDPNGYMFAVEYDISQIAVGDTLQVSMSLNNKMNVGIQNGLIS